MIPTIHPTEPHRESDGLEFCFVRRVHKVLLPAGRIQKLEDSYKVEMVEADVVTVYNPTTQEEVQVAIDPRHPQARDQLKLIQDLLRGRLGGQTPVKLGMEIGAARDPDGAVIGDSEFLRLAEIETPAPARGENKVVKDGEVLGEWTAELDSAVDRAVSFEIMDAYAAFMGEVASRDDAGAWEEIDANAKIALAAIWSERFLEKGQLEAEIERVSPTRDEFLRGEVRSHDNRPPEQMVFDPVLNDLPSADIPANELAQQALFVYQRAFIERFQQRMLEETLVLKGGEVEKTNVLQKVEGELEHEGKLPAKHPKRDKEVTRLIVEEKARALATHLLAAELQAKGAAVRCTSLAEELRDPKGISADVQRCLEANPGIRPEDYGAEFTRMASERAKAYKHDAHNRVRDIATRTLKFPEKAPVEPSNVGKKVVDGLSSAARAANQSAETLEGISYGL